MRLEHSVRFSVGGKCKDDLVENAKYKLIELGYDINNPEGKLEIEPAFLISGVIVGATCWYSIVEEDNEGLDF